MSWDVIEGNWKQFRSRIKEKYTNAGLEARSSTPEELGTRMKSDYSKIAKLIKEAGIRLD